jgi:hypothetical protein
VRSVRPLRLERAQYRPSHAVVRGRDEQVVEFDVSVFQEEQRRSMELARGRDAIRRGERELVRPALGVGLQASFVVATGRMLASDFPGAAKAP